MVNAIGALIGAPHLHILRSSRRPIPRSPAQAKFADGRATPSIAPSAQSCTRHGLGTAALAEAHWLWRFARSGSYARSPPPVSGEWGAAEKLLIRLGRVAGRWSWLVA